MARSKLTSKGQTTIPMMVRERMGLQQGDAIDFVFLEDGTVNMRPVKHTVLALAGRLAPARGAASIKEMHAALLEHAARRQRSLSRRKKR